MCRGREYVGAWICSGRGCVVGVDVYKERGHGHGCAVGVDVHK
jgi:hypothetical protein